MHIKLLNQEGFIKIIQKVSRTLPNSGTCRRSSVTARIAGCTNVHGGREKVSLRYTHPKRRINKNKLQLHKYIQEIKSRSNNILLVPLNTQHYHLVKLINTTSLQLYSIKCCQEYNDR